MTYRAPAPPPSTLSPEVLRAIAKCDAQIARAQSGFAFTRPRRRGAIAAALREAVRDMGRFADAAHQGRYLDLLVESERDRLGKGDHRGAPLATALALRAEFRGGRGDPVGSARDWHESIAFGRAAGGPYAPGDGLGPVWLGACAAARATGDAERHRRLAEELAGRERAVAPRTHAAALGELSIALAATGNGEGALEVAIRRAEYVARSRLKGDWTEHASACRQVLEVARRFEMLWSCDRYVSQWIAAARVARGTAARASLAEARAWESAIHRDTGSAFPRR